MVSGIKINHFMLIIFLCLLRLIACRSLWIQCPLKTEKLGGFCPQMTMAGERSTPLPNDGSSFAIERSTDSLDLPAFEGVYQALMQGNWCVIENFVLARPNILTERISADGQTLLHVAVLYQQEGVVEKLLEMLNPEDLGTKDGNGDTPLHYSAINGNIKIARCMIMKYRGLANIENSGGELPVVLACRHGDREMTMFLYRNTRPEFLQSNNDIALDIIDKHPHLVVVWGMDGLTPLAAFAQRPALFPRESYPLWFWQRCICSCITVKVDQAGDKLQEDMNSDKKVSCKFLLRLASYLLKLSGIKNIYTKKLMHAQAKELLQRFCVELRNSDPYSHRYVLHQTVIKAVKHGNVEFVTDVIHHFPELKWIEDGEGRNIFSYAILHRQEKIFNLLHGLLSKLPNKERLTYARDNFGNNILHLAALLAPSDQLDGISGAALQMQREVQWYKKVESIAPPICKDLLNSNGKTPSEVFAEQHANLVNEGEIWMKEIATSSSFVAALIVTIMFAAAFTIPGGNNDKGSPILLEDTLFMVFIAFDSLSLISATTSVLMFLGILTSQYAKQRFLKRLPTTKLITGLSTLFISIVTMMISFCAALAILLKESSTKVILIPIIALSCVMVTLFAIIQFPLLVNICILTFGT